MGNPFKKILKTAKKVVKKLIPKEAAGIMQMAAPFIAPTHPWLAAGLSGLGQYKQKGKINPLLMALSSAPGWGTAGGTQAGYLRKGIKQLPWEFGKYDRSMDELLFGTKYSTGVLQQLDMEKNLSGLLGAFGEYAPLSGRIADIGFRKATKEGYEGISLLKSAAWGSGIISGIQAGRYRDAQEAARAAEEAARGEGITDEEWLMAARAEAEAAWAEWAIAAEGKFNQGGRVGYQLGVGPVGGIGAMQPQMQIPMNPQMQTQMNPQMQTQMNPQMQTPPPREGGLGRLPIEADMRYTGGFMPYGETEKADDVPARLSKNEFVFTADAVKAAGGGSVNQGAKKLYDTMKQLEKMA